MLLVLIVDLITGEHKTTVHLVLSRLNKNTVLTNINLVNSVNKAPLRILNQLKCKRESSYCNNVLFCFSLAYQQPYCCSVIQCSM